MMQRVLPHPLWELQARKSIEDPSLIQVGADAPDNESREDKTSRIIQWRAGCYSSDQHCLQKEKKKKIKKLRKRKKEKENEKHFYIILIISSIVVLLIIIIIIIGYICFSKNKKMEVSFKATLKFSDDIGNNKIEISPNFNLNNQKESN